MNDERLKLLAGQRLVAGFEGYTVPESFQKLIRDCKIGNVILFRRNIRSAEQLRELCVFLHCLIRMETGLPPMILLDEEGYGWDEAWYITTWMKRAGRFPVWASWVPFHPAPWRRALPAIRRTLSGWAACWGRSFGPLA